MRRLPRVEPTGDDLPPGCRLWRAVGVCNACVFECPTRSDALPRGDRLWHGERMILRDGDAIVVVNTDSDHRRDRRLWLWCPGCADLHQVVVATEDGVEPPSGPVWGWDGDTVTPTIEPSILVEGGSRNVRCHSYVRAGVWEFLTDSTHGLAGQTFPMADVRWPKHLLD